MIHRYFLRLEVLLVAVLVFLASSSQAATYPVAAVKPADGSLFVLAADGTVLAISLSTTVGLIVGRCSSNTPGIVSDLAYGVIDGQPCLFIASSRSTGTAIFGLLQEFTTDGHLLGSWITGHVAAGISFDSSSQTVYFSSGDSAEIYAFKPNSKSAPSFVAQVSGASKLGSLTIDPAAHQLYVSDVTQGSIFALSLANHSARSIGQLGTPQALLLNNRGSILFVADGGRRQIVSLALNAGPASTSNVTPRNSLRNPTGLAWADATHLIVTDQGASSVSLVDSASGTIIYSMHL